MTDTLSFSKIGLKLMPVNGASPGFEPVARRRLFDAQRFDDDDGAMFGSKLRRKRGIVGPNRGSGFDAGRIGDRNHDARAMSDTAERAVGDPIGPYVRVLEHR